MGIQTNDSGAGVVDNKADQPNNDLNNGPGATFAGVDVGTGGAPMGGFDFQALRDVINLDRTDSTVEPYLTEVLKQVQRKLPDVTYERVQRMNGAYVFRYDGSDGYKNFFGIQFVNTNDPVSPQFVPSSQRIGPLMEQLKNQYGAANGDRIRLADARVIIAGYEPEMSRTTEMAATIVRVFSVVSIREAKDAKIESLVGTEFSADWSVSEARKLERQLSPHGVPPRMDIALTLKAKIQNNYGRELRDFEVDYQPLGVIGGYIELRDREPFTINGQQVALYRPIFNITVCNAFIPLEGVFSILLAAFAPTIYNSKHWVRQWSNLAEGEPQPGLLEEDFDNKGKPYVLKTLEEVTQFANTYFAVPEIAFQFQDGKDSIPGVWRLASGDAAQKRHFIDRLTNFFGTQQEDPANVELSRIFEVRSEGVFGEPNGQLTDSRQIDYLWIAAKNGFGSIDPFTRSVLLGGAGTREDRARIVSQVTGGYTPLYLTQGAAINAEFIKWIVSKTEGRRLTIVDPNSQAESRSFGQFLAGFGTSTGIGSIVTSGQVNRGLGLNSVWSGGY